MVSIVGAMNAGVMAGPRVYYAQAKDGLLFHRFATVHPKHTTPSYSIWAQTIWSCLLAATGSYEALITYAAFTSWLFYALTAAGLFLLRKRRPDAERPYKVWGYPWTPAIFILVSSAFVLNTMIASPGPAFSGIGLIALGIPYYLWLDRKPALSATASQGH
jgi:APA family basic amino acid/polyamine antiporter